MLIHEKKKCEFAYFHDINLYKEFISQPIENTVIHRYIKVKD